MCVCIDWKEYAKASDIWIPQRADSNQDSEDDSRFDSEEWEEPDYDLKYEYFSTQQELRTMDKIVEDLIKEIIQLAIQYVTSFYRKNEEINNNDQITLLQILKGNENTS